MGRAGRATFSASSGIYRDALKDKVRKTALCLVQLRLNICSRSVSQENDIVDETELVALHGTTYTMYLLAPPPDVV